MAALILVKKQSLQWYFTDRDGPLVCPMPQEAVTDLEVASEVALESAINKSLGTAPVRPTVPTVLALTDELTFPQKLDPKNEAETVKTFVASIPFSQVATATFHVQETGIIMATNEELYETIVRILSGHGYVVTYVVPWAAMTMLGINLQGAIDRVTVKHIFDGLGTIKSASFPLEAQQAVLSPVVSHAPTKSGNKIPIWWIIFGTASFIYLLVMVWFFLRK